MSRLSTIAALAAFAGLAAGTAFAADDATHPLQSTSTAAIEAGLADAPVAQASLALNEDETKAFRAALAAYRRGALTEGDAQAAALPQGEARTLLEWAALRYAAGAAPFDRIARFLAAHPNYPGTTLFRRRAEEALIAHRKRPELVRAFFHGQRPLSPAGRIALALALDAEGRKDEARTLAARIWRGDLVGTALEKIVLDAFGAALTADDHRQRTERYLFAGQNDGALRNAARVSSDYVALAKVRLASAKARSPLPDKQIAALPATLKSEPGYWFLMAQQARRAQRFEEAGTILAAGPRDPERLGDGDGWWEERRLVSRKLLDMGQTHRAYEVAAAHGAEGDAERIDGEWHAGFIALRYRDDAAAAERHFAEAARFAETPISASRVAYWRGRAAEALGKQDEAQAQYRSAAQHPIAYYGQLARARLGMPGLPLRSAGGTSLEGLPAQRAVKLLYETGERDLAAVMIVDAAQRLHSSAALEALAAIPERERDARAQLALGKTALQRGFALDAAAFPTGGVPDFPTVDDPVERAMVHAVARQESAFDPTAQSHAGARGLMQMMPATARETARRFDLPFDWARLGRDPSYAAQMGAAHLGDLLKDWRGSYVLVFAAYNAGGGNVRRWVEAYGDPRKPGVDAVDWVERIPFGETRNYVQRVMENLQVYRERLNQRTAYLIDQDLKRGGRAE